MLDRKKLKNCLLFRGGPCALFLAVVSIPETLYFDINIWQIVAFSVFIAFISYFFENSNKHG